MPSSGFNFGRRRAIFLGLGCGLFIYLLIRLGTGEIVSLLLRIGWSFPLILVIYTGYAVVRASAVTQCIPAREHSSYGTVLGVWLAGEAIQYLTFTGPFVAEPAMALLLRNRGLRTTHAFAATIAEYLIYTFTSATMTGAGLIYLLHAFDVPHSLSVAGRIVIGIAVIFLSTAAVAIVGKIYLIGTVLNGIRKLPRIGKYVRIDEKGLRDTEDLLFEVLRAQPRRLLTLVATEFLAQAVLVFELLVLLKATGEPLQLAHPVLIESATKFISLGFFFIPGQVGASEAVYALIFKAVGLTASSGFTLALARRLRTLLIAGAGLTFVARFSGRTKVE